MQFDRELTILTGRNGSGKTTILNFISALLQKRFSAFFTIPFSSAIAEFDTFSVEVVKSGRRVLVKYADCARRIEKDLLEAGYHLSDYERQIISGYDDNDPTQKHEDLEDLDDFEEILGRYRVVARRPIYGTSENSYDDFIMEEKALYFPTYRRFETDLSNILAYASGGAGRSLARRLQSLQEDLTSQVAPGVVVGYSNQDIGQVVGHRWSLATEYEKARLNSLVRSFTISLVDQHPEQHEPSDTDLTSVEQTLLTALEKAHILQAGDESIIRGYSRRVRQGLEARQEGIQTGEGVPVERVYAVLMFPIVRQLSALWERARQDIDRQWEPFEQLKQTLTRFLDKSVDVQDDGTLTFTTRTQELGFEHLSAGEKQLVAFFVYVGLGTEPGTIILIDEPELSLHVQWQRELLPSLLEMGHGRQFITSTHSPFIVGKFHTSLYQVGEAGE